MPSLTFQQPPQRNPRYASQPIERSTQQHSAGHKFILSWVNCCYIAHFYKTGHNLAIAIMKCIVRTRTHYIIMIMMGE